MKGGYRLKLWLFKGVVHCERLGLCSDTFSFLKFDSKDVDS
jgi:hypothetical protein